MMMRLRLALSAILRLARLSMLFGTAVLCLIALIGPRTWSHPSLGFTLSSNKRNGWQSNLEMLHHNLCESWRHCHYHGWLDSDRRDALCCHHVGYDAKRCLSGRNAAVLSRSSRAVLSGAFVSPAVYGIMKGHRDDDEAKACPFCHSSIGTLEHVVWHCRALPDSSDRSTSVSMMIACLCGTRM